MGHDERASEIVLIVEDNRGTADLIMDVLKGAGISFAHVESGKAGKEWMDSRSPILVLLDYSLPDMHASIFLDDLGKSIGAIPPFVIITGVGDERIAVEMMKRGAKDYLIKDGMFLENLPNVIRRVLREIKMERELKQAQTALLESEKRLRRVVEGMPVLMIAFNANREIVAWNAESQRVTGYPPEEVIGQTEVLSWLYPEESYRRKIHESIQNREGSFYGVESNILCKNKTLRTILWYNVSQQFPIPGWATWKVGVDVTERKHAEEENRKLEEQMMHTQKLESLGVLAGGIAHDFNNLLMVILGNIDLTMADGSLSVSSRENLEAAEKASHRAADLCRQMLAYSGKGKLLVELFHFNHVIEDMSKMLEISISKKIAVQYNFSSSLPPVEGDVTQIRQVIMNLIINASEAIGEKSGILTVSTGSQYCEKGSLHSAWTNEHLAEGSYIYFEVKDTGCGMDHETMSKIFDPFFTTKFKGRGLGLAAVLGIVRGHKGTICVESEKGKGSTFRVLMPAFTDPTRTLPAEEEKSFFSQGRGKILVADDEPHVLTLVKKVLKKLGFEVITAVDGKDAVEKFQANPHEISCVLLDMTMPEMNGEEAFYEMQRIQKEVRVILSSGYNEQEIAQHFVGKGLAGVLQKPYKIETLRKKIMEVISER